jgi:hypothetical protein
MRAVRKKGSEKKFDKYVRKKTLFFMVTLGLHAFPCYFNQYVIMSWWDITIENVRAVPRLTCSTPIGCDVMLSSGKQKALLVLRKIRDLNVNLENNWNDSVSITSCSTDWHTGNAADFVFGRYMLRISGRDTSYHDWHFSWLFSALSEIFRVETAMRLQGFPPIPPPILQ